jgi:PAS domain S-box-containing protein
MDKRRLPAGALEKNAAFVGNGLDLPGFAEDILQLAPDTTNIVCVIGASPVERYWTAEFQSEFARFTNRVSFTWLNDLPFDQMLERLKRLPPRSFVFVILMLRDAAGVAYDSGNVLKQIREAANAPVNSIFEHQLGLGIVGGRLYSSRAEGVEAARIAFRILRGEPASSLPPVILKPVGPQYDWRELQRWRIPERSLPPGSSVQFRELTIWERYRGWILGGISVFVFEGAIIASLLMHRIKRRKAETALKVSEERYREVVESQTDLVYRFLADGTLTFVNAAYCRFFGHTREKMIGRKFYEFLPEKAHAAAKESVVVLNRDRRPLIAEYEAILPDGSIGWQHWVDYPVVGPDGKVTEFQGIGRDITDRKRAEAANLKLTHASRLATVGELTGMVLHDLSQPLSAILCNARAAELILQNSNPPMLKEVPDILADIRHDSQRASQTVLRMRTLLRHRHLELKAVDLSALVAEVLQIVSPEAARRRVQMKSDFSAECPPVKGDRVHLQQVLLNLMLNGMDAMANTPESKRFLLIRASQNGHGVEVAVSDTGQGIPLEKLPHIFDSFFTTKEEGLGLGLSIAKWIVEAHGGHIVAENDAKGGATFRFTLATSITPD